MTISINNEPIEYFNFHGGECHVSIADINIYEVTTIKAYLYNSDEIMRLFLLVDAARRKNPRTLIHLIIPYFPYARQDRVCNPGEAYSVVVMANMINSLRCESVTVYDPHSSHTSNMLNDCKVISQGELIANSSLGKRIKDDYIVLVSPDAGAEDKTRELMNRLDAPAIFCTKERDTKTGEIKGVHIPPVIEYSADFLIVDDICDGGRTFIELAKRLQDVGVRDLYLYVTHGIFSNGFDELKKHFKHVYCYHTFWNKDFLDNYKDFVTVLEGEK